MCVKRVAILQSNYIPWRGYFDIIASVDEFIFYDDVQYTTRDWRNRNRIKTPQGAQWLSVPVGDKVHRLIQDVTVSDPTCGRDHWKRLAANYTRAEHFRTVAAWLEPLYAAPWTSLSGLNRQLIEAVCAYLGIGARFTNSRDYKAGGDRNERLIALCRASGADVYVSGPSAKSYLDEAAFAGAGVAVSWMDYSGYPEYRQLWGGDFLPDLSILDLLFNSGPEAGRFMKHVPA